MVYRRTRNRLRANQLPLVWLTLCMLLAPGCGDGGGEGGIGGGGTSGLGTIGGGEGTAASVYVTNTGSNDVSAYSINQSTGGLAVISGSPFVDVPAPSAIALSSNGFFAYIANGRTNKVTAFRIGTNGALLLGASTPDTPNPASVGTAPRALAISRDSRFLYVANSGSDTVTGFSIGAAGVLTLVPQTTGNPNPVSAGGLSPVALAMSSTGRVLYVANSTSSTITTFQVESSGLLTQVPQAGPGTNPISTNVAGPTALAMSPNGQFLYVTNSASNTVTAFRVETSGLLTLIPPTGSTPNPVSTGGTTPNSIAVVRNGVHLYIANGGGTVSAFTIGSNGLLALVPASGTVQNPTPTLVAGSTPTALTISQDGQFLYVANSGGTVSAYTIASDSGTLIPLTQLLGNPFRTGTNPSAIAVSGPTL
ncbi:MAG: lactonase family protein [Nitrospira sp.]|nr:lactonase family protein [Nitrospira sp.]